MITDALPLTAKRSTLACDRSVQHSVQPGRSIADVRGFATRPRGAEPAELVRKVE
jgi:hypothetical protein